MFKIIYSKNFQLNLIDIKNYIATDNPFYAIQVINNIELIASMLKTYPLIWKEIYSNYRIITEPTYKFKIVYEIKKDYIYILSVFKYKNSWE